MAYELYDYVSSPKETGYRASHVVVLRDDRLIEIQLRTRRQHAWAAAVERLSGQPELTRLKDGVGPDAIVRFYRAASEILALQEQGTPVDSEMAEAFILLRRAFDEALAKLSGGR